MDYWKCNCGCSNPRPRKIIYCRKCDKSYEAILMPIGLDILRSGDIARELGVSPRVARRWLEEGSIKNIQNKYTGSRTVHRVDLEEFMAGFEEGGEGNE